MFRYFIVYKPYKTLSQFTSVLNKNTLTDFFSVPKNVYPVGRLDEDSEGLLILTNDAKLNHRLLNPNFEHEREYWVQVEGEITDEAKNPKLKTAIHRCVSEHLFQHHGLK